MKNDPIIYKFLRFIAIIGNLIFVLWILRNGVNEGFKANIIQIVSYIGLIFLLILNTFLLYGSQRKKY
jgi:hypothetical protein